MNFFNRVEVVLSDPLRTFRIFERLIAIFCMVIPVLLRLGDRGYPGVFFLGNAVVIGLFHAPRDRVLSIVLAVITVVAIALHFIMQARVTRPAAQ